MIQLKNIFFTYPGANQYALDDITLTIKKGEKVAIIGNNGSGKSTLAKAINGMIRPADGEILVDGILLNTKNLMAIRRKIGFVFQNPELQFIGATVIEDLAFGLENINTPRAKIKEEISRIIKENNIESLLHHTPKSLSGGQKQRVAIASALIMNGNYLVLDEVTSMLDSLNRILIWDLLEKLHQQNDQTIISITHNMDEASLSDRIIVMSHGKIVADGKPVDILGKGTEKFFSAPSFETEIANKLGHQTDLSFADLVSHLCK